MAFPINPVDGQIYKNYIYESISSAWYRKNQLNGSSPYNAAPSGYYLAKAFPGLSSGYYWIQSQFMPNPLQMYVDMTEEGGGFDFYPITNGSPVKDMNSAHDGNALGLDLVIPRSKAHWKAIYNYTVNVLGSSASVYMQAIPIYRTTGPDSAGGNYTTYIMNSYAPTPDWKVKDGGRWWLRDSVFSEPNGDYNHNGFLWLYSYTVNSDGSLSGFNDFITANESAITSNYLLSTNLKP